MRWSPPPVERVIGDGSTPPNVVRGADLAAVAAARAGLDAAAGEGRAGRRRRRGVDRAHRERGGRQGGARAALTGDAHPRVAGIFGTFEQAQEQVLALARAGAGVLVADLPLERDIADLLAQVKALVVGATPALYAR